MFCKFCGKEIKDRSVFCEFCGKDLNRDVESATVEENLKKYYPNLNENSYGELKEQNAKILKRNKIKKTIGNIIKFIVTVLILAAIAIIVIHFFGDSLGIKENPAIGDILKNIFGK